MPDNKLVLEIAVDDKGSIVVKQFTDKTKEAFNEMKKGPEAAKGPLESLSQSWIGITAKIGITTAAIYAAKRVTYDFAKEISSEANAIERQAAIVGISTDEFQKWQYAAKMSNVNAQELAIGIKLLSRNMEDASSGSGDAAKYFSAMGVSVKTTEGHLRPLNQVMGDVMDKFATWEDGPRKIAIAMQLFGRSGETLIPLLNRGSAGFAEFAKEAERLGIILSPDLVKKGSEAEDAFKRIGAQWQALKLSFTPAAKALAESLEPVLAIVNLISVGIGKIKGFSEGIERWKYKTGLGSVEYEKKLDAAEMARETAEYYRNMAKPFGKPPQISDLKKYFEEQKPYYESLSKQAEQIERMAYGGMENKAFFDQLKEQKELEENLKKVEGERAQQLADDMFPSLEKVAGMVDQGNKYWSEQNAILAETKSLIDQMDWEDVASGVRTLSSETERSINVTKIATEKLIDEWNKTKDVFASIGDNISSVWATNMSKMITDATNWKDALDNIWKGMADTFISALMKMATNWVLFGQTKGSEGWSGKTGSLGTVFSLISSIAGLSGALGQGGSGSEAFVTKGYQSGIDYVPSTGLYQLHKGEAVIPVGENKESKGDTYITNTYIEATDVGSFERKYGPVIESVYARGKRFRKVSMR